MLKMLFSNAFWITFGVTAVLAIIGRKRIRWGARGLAIAFLLAAVVAVARIALLELDAGSFLLTALASVVFLIAGGTYLRPINAESQTSRGASP